MKQKNTTQVPVPTHDFRVLLSPTPRGARLARLLAVEWLRDRELPYDVAGAAPQVVAELAANAATHGRVGGRNFRLVLRVSPEALRIEVTDTRAEALPQLRTPAPDEESGRGMLLVAALADRWGTVLGPVPQKTVWAEFDVTGRPASKRLVTGAVVGLLK
ncbi:ATP-binding protein [Streptomyces venezuelae]|uniref:ATP-binding protein n=1 Tax=Streptomyces venezuelae TaxID=54571 RepID=UPI00278BDCAF|nr:ATP-binding protein [Streptomyces venezuelae]